MTSFWTGERVRLRAVEPGDWPAFQELDQHSADQRNTDMLYPPRSAEGYRRWAEERAVARPDRDRVELVIATLDTDTVVGSLSTFETDQRAGRFGYGLSVGRPFQRSGYATEAARILLAFMFDERRYHRATVQIYASNEASIGLHRKLGFTPEGRLREHEFLDGKYEDVLVMGLLAAEFTRSSGA